MPIKINGGIKMLKTVLVILCVLLLIGMLALDMFISKDINRSSGDGSENDKDNKE